MEHKLIRKVTSIIVIVIYYAIKLGLDIMQILLFRLSGHIHLLNKVYFFCFWYNKALLFCFLLSLAVLCSIVCLPRASVV